MSDFSVNVVNPGNPSRRRRRRGASRKNPANPSRRGRRGRRNPDWGRQTELFRFDWGSLVWMLAGDLWISYFTRTWGDQWGTSMLDAKQITSPYGGQAWTLKNYLMALATGYGIARVMEYAGDKRQQGALWKARARNFFLGVKFGVIRRLIWTEGFGRWEWASKYFGDVQDVYNDRGAVWMATPGGYQQAMDGPQRDPRAWQMLGPIRDGEPWQMLGPGDEYLEPEEIDPRFMGHALVGNGQSADLSKYQYTGAESPYQSSYNG